MKTSYGKAVQWKDGDAELTGVLVTDARGRVFQFYSGVQCPAKVQPQVKILVAHSYTRELEFVEFGKLSDYPAEPIPQP